MSENTKAQKIKEKLFEAFMERAKLASAVYLVVGVIIFLTYFNSEEFKTQIKAASFIIAFSSFVRLIVLRVYANSSLWKMKEKMINIYLFLSLLNGIALGGIIAYVTLGEKLVGPSAAQIILMAVGFSAGSVTTLGYIPWLYFTYNSMLILPMLSVAIYFATQTPSPVYNQFVIYFGIYFFFILLQGLKVSKDMIKMVTDEVVLNDSNAELKTMTDQLTQETLRSQHSSRLASLGEMAGGIAHEINNPLAIINGHIQQLEKQIKNENFDLTQVLLRTEKVKSAVERIAKTVKGLRQFSKQSDGDPLEVVPLAKVFSDTLDFCSEKLKASGIDLILRDEDNLSINCRPVQISQVLINMINNAHDAIEHLEGSKWIRIDSKLIGSKIIISVSNCGPKIPESVQQKLFQPFFTTKEIGKGTGLGLSISKGILNQHGGEITLDNNEYYTCFRITLPAPAADTQNSVKAS